MTSKKEFSWEPNFVAELERIDSFTVKFALQRLSVNEEDILTFIHGKVNIVANTMTFDPGTFLSLDDIDELSDIFTEIHEESIEMLE